MRVFNYFSFLPLPFREDIQNFTQSSRPFTNKAPPIALMHVRSNNCLNFNDGLIRSNRLTIRNPNCDRGSRYGSPIHAPTILTLPWKVCFFATSICLRRKQPSGPFGSFILCSLRNIAAFPWRVPWKGTFVPYELMKGHVYECCSSQKVCFLHLGLKNIKATFLLFFFWYRDHL